MNNRIVSARPEWNDGKPVKASQLFVHTRKNGRIVLNSFGWGHRSTEAEFPNFAVVNIPSVQLQQDESIFFISKSVLLYCDKAGLPMPLNIAGSVPTIKSVESFHYFPATLNVVDSLMKQTDLFLLARMKEGFQEGVEIGFLVLDVLQRTPLTSISTNDFLDFIFDLQNDFAEGRMQPSEEIVRSIEEYELLLAE